MRRALSTFAIVILTMTLLILPVVLSNSAGTLMLMSIAANI
jgi:hypothetical protein